MKVHFKIGIGGDYYDFDHHWELPHFPRIGDSLELEEILDPDDWEKAKNVVFEGKERYYGLTRTLAQLLQDCYQIKVREINWMRYSVEVWLDSDKYDLKFWMDTRYLKK